MPRATAPRTCSRSWELSRLLQRGRLEDGSAATATGALRMATIDGAGALGLDGLVGSMEPGKRADLVLLDLPGSPRTVAMHDVISQVVQCAQSADVLVDGKVVVERRRPVGADLPALLREARTPVGTCGCVSRPEPMSFLARASHCQTAPAPSADGPPRYRAG